MKRIEHTITNSNVVTHTHTIVRDDRCFNGESTINMQRARANAQRAMQRYDMGYDDVNVCVIRHDV